MILLKTFNTKFNWNIPKKYLKTCIKIPKNKFWHILLSSRSHYAIALRRNAFIRKLNEIYVRNWGLWAHRAANSGIISLMPFNMEQPTLQWTSFHRICGALHFYFDFFFFFIMPMSCVFFDSAGCCYLTHSFVTGLNFVSTFWLPFTTLNIWHLLSAGRRVYRRGVWREGGGEHYFDLFLI